eukprot:1158714-Pelagomonas_calceolata.AAC.7
MGVLNRALEHVEHDKDGCWPAVYQWWELWASAASHCASTNARITRKAASCRPHALLNKLKPASYMLDKSA